MPAHLKRANVWPFRKRTPAPRRECARRSSLSVSEAVKAAYKAGVHSGNDFAFEGWLCERGLNDRGNALVSRLQTEYHRGVEDGEATPAPAPAPARAPAPAPARAPDLGRERPSRARTAETGGTPLTKKFQGYTITRQPDGEWTTSLDPESHFDTEAEVRTHIREWLAGRRNPVLTPGPGVYLPNESATPGKYRLSLLPHSIGGGYYIDTRHPDGSYTTSPDFRTPDYAKSWAASWRQSLYSPYAVLPAIAWKPDRSHWGHYSAEIVIPRVKGRNPAGNPGPHMYPKQALALDLSTATPGELRQAESILFKAAMRAVPSSPMQRELNTKYWEVRKVLGTHPNPRTPGLKSHLRDTLDSYDTISGGVFRYTAGLPSTIGHAVLGSKNPCPEGMGGSMDAMRNAQPWTLPKARYAYVVVRYDRNEVIGYGERGEAIYAPQRQTFDSKAAAVARGKQLHRETGDRVEVYDPNNTNRVIWEGRANPAASNPEQYYAFVGPYKGSKVQIKSGERFNVLYGILLDEYRNGRGPIKVWEIGTWQDYEAVRGKLNKRGGPAPNWTITDDDLYRFREAYLGIEDEGGEYDRRLNAVVEAVAGKRSNPGAGGNMEPVADTVPSEIPLFSLERASLLEAGVAPIVEYTQLNEAVAYAQAVKGMHPGVGVVGMEDGSYGVVLQSEAVREADEWEANTELGEVEAEGIENPAGVRYTNIVVALSASKDLHGPFLQMPRGARVEIVERGKGGHRFLVTGSYYGERQVWGWVDKEYLDPRPNEYSNPALAVSNPVEANDAEAVANIRAQFAATTDPRQKAYLGALLKFYSYNGRLPMLSDTRGDWRENPALWPTPGRIDGDITATAETLARGRRLFTEAEVHRVGEKLIAKLFGRNAMVEPTQAADIHRLLWNTYEGFGPPMGKREKKWLDKHGVKALRRKYAANPVEFLSLAQARDLGYKAGEARSQQDEGRYRHFREHFQKARDLEAHGDITKRRTLEDAYNEGYSEGADRGYRSNPLFPATDSAASADDLYTDFHGEPPSRHLEIATEVEEPVHLAELGTLVSLKVATPTKLEVTLGFEEDPPYLASSADGRQLYIEGGNQQVDLSGLKMSGKEWERPNMMLGDLIETTYRTAKKFDKFKTIDYYHANGEESGIPPQLVYDPVNKLLTVVGGKYKVKPEGIVD